jgi:UDP-N-acetylmuramate dehydrogenase
MYILENVPLASYSTMRLGGTAAFFTDITSRQDLLDAIAWATERDLPMILIGEGSNIIWDDDGYPGLVMVNKIMGFDVTGEYVESRYLTLGAGENWDAFVARTVEMDLTGIEFLSLIPGTVGATPVQNVGAYGAEVSSTISTIEAYDNLEKKMVTLRGSDCNFGYRTSRFKTSDKGRFFITSVTFLLQQTKPQPPFYAALEKYFTDHSVTDITPAAIREAVIAIRSSKLPDPKLVANNGSFFANPILSSADFFELVTDFPNVPHWNTADGKVKVSAAWLIEQAGFKDHHDAETGMATWPQQPLVLVNESAETTAQLKAFKQKIVEAVQQKFKITLEQEPELI